MTTRPNSGEPPSRLDPERIPRRDFLGLSALSAAAVALGFGFLGMIRLPKAAVVASPSRKFQVTLPETLADGEPFLPPGRSVALFRDGDGVYALSLICTHLGCIVNRVSDGFECPCHGSRFEPDGTVTKGPAPTPLVWCLVTGRGGTYTVDVGSPVTPGTKWSA